MQGRGPACGRPSLHFRALVELRRQLADPRRPVGKRRSRPDGTRSAGTRTKQVVARTTVERAQPGGVVTRVGDVLAGDPDGVAVHRRRAVVTPTRALRVREVLGLVAREPVLGRSAGTT